MKKERDPENERLKKAWLKKHKVTKCITAYLTIAEKIMPSKNLIRTKY